MGQQKQRRLRFFSEHPICCFCGGEAAAEEIEHYPPKVMFIGKQRPAGFEFPACISCNRVTRKSDSVVSFFAKYASANAFASSRQKEFEKDAIALAKYCPTTYDEILEGRYGNRALERKLSARVKEKVSVITTGATQKKHLEVFAIKMTAAAFYQVTGKIAPAGTLFSIFQHTQVDFTQNQFPNELDNLGLFHTMSQGTWDVADQFAYRHSVTKEGDAGIFQFLFHKNLLISAFLFADKFESLDQQRLIKLEDMKHPPGELKSKSLSISMRVSQPYDTSERC